MERFRTNPPQQLGGSKVIKIKDFKTQRILDPLRNPIGHTLLPRSNVLQFVLEDDSLITVRPSGTEPKIKYYFSVNERQVNQTNFASVDKLLNDRLAILETEMKSY